MGSDNLRELNIATNSAEPAGYDVTLLAKARDLSFPSLTRIYCSLTSGVMDALDEAHVLHATYLDDLTICCTDYEYRILPEFLPSVALKRYAFHHSGYDLDVEVSIFPGWSRPLTSSIASLQSLELTIRSPIELVECGLPALLERGNSFSQLKAVSLAMAYDQRFDAFIPLLMLCPRVQDLALSTDVTGLSSLHHFGHLINSLPNSVALKRLIVGLRIWDLQIAFRHRSMPHIPPNESFDNHLAIFMQFVSAQRLKSFKIRVSRRSLEAFGFPQVAEVCRSRRIAFAVEWHPNPGMRV